jgi:DUF4097 and DUF4098 domain-containing protein YvlB
MHRFAVPLTLVLALATSGCIVDAQGRTAEGSFSRQLAITGPVTLTVETGSGDVDIRTAETTSVSVEGRIRAGWGFWDGDGNATDRVEAIERNPPVVQSGNDIRIDRPRGINNVRISYTITVPRTSTLDLRTGSGDVQVTDVAGPVTVRTGSGDILVGHVDTDVRLSTGSGDVELDEGRGEIRVATGSGDVLVRQAGSARADVRTGSGDVEIGRASAAMHVRTGSGGILVEGAPSAEWDFAAGSGDVMVNVPDDAAFDVHARAGSGPIDIEAVVSTGTRNRREVRGTVRGGGALLSLATGSGEIRVR